MLEEIRIRGLGVIDDAVLELSPGLTVVTGETGAGKTMVVTGLGLLFGGRADAGLIRPGTAQALVEGRIVMPADSPAIQRAVDAGAELEDGVLLASRAVSAEGRSRGYLSGRSVPVGLLADLAEDLVAVHGQADQQRLLRPARQRAALDQYAGSAVTEPLDRYAETYRRLQEISRQLAELVHRARDRASDADFLRFGLDEIAKIAPRPGEDDELAVEAERLSHADALRSAATVAHESLLGDPAAVTAADAAGLIGTAHAALEQARQHDAALAELADRLAQISYLLSDVASELASYTAGIEADPVRLAAAQERQAVLAGLRRKYGADMTEVLAWAERATIRLAELDGVDDWLDELVADREKLGTELAAMAGEISMARQNAAQRFAAAVTAELAALAMPHARVTVAVTQTPLPSVPSAPSDSGQASSAEALATDIAGLEVDGRLLVYGSTGVDEVEILLAAHPGAPARPLAKGASGGELSRIMLAVEAVFAGADPAPTFVFDEVDAGVGGKAAVEVGRRLARLARTAQVLVVTHLPQVAAFADRHLLVEKTSDGRVTSSGVITLDEPSRLRELSRMLAGLEDSALARAHAEELLATARAAKNEAER